MSANPEGWKGEPTACTGVNRDSVDARAGGDDGQSLRTMTEIDPLPVARLTRLSTAEGRTRCHPERVTARRAAPEGKKRVSCAVHAPPPWSAGVPPADAQASRACASGGRGKRASRAVNGHPTSPPGGPHHGVPASRRLTRRRPAPAPRAGGGSVHLALRTPTRGGGAGRRHVSRRDGCAPTAGRCGVRRPRLRFPIHANTKAEARRRTPHAAGRWRPAG
jgi:hypothetical protein